MSKRGCSGSSSGSSLVELLSSLRACSRIRRRTATTSVSSDNTTVATIPPQSPARDRDRAGGLPGDLRASPELREALENNLMLEMDDGLELADGASGAAETCKGCPRGRWSDKVGVAQESRCQNCPPGKYGRDAVGQTSNASCAACAAASVVLRALLAREEPP